MPIPRDDKDWTWVLQRPCPECGFDASKIAGHDVGARLRDQLPIWHEVLASDAAMDRPDEQTWSPTEYACHVRDVAVLYAHRLHRMLTEDDPEYLNWSSDDAAIDGAYDRQQPEVVLAQLARDLGELAEAFDAVSEQEWTRSGRRSDGAVFTVDSFARYLLHDVVHHGWDVTRNRATG
jgi:hypothetical protein